MLDGRLGIRAREQYGELVSPEPGHHPGAGATALVEEPLSGHAQQQVTGTVPEGVVDVLEVVEVEQQHGGRLATGHRLLYGVAEGPTVR